jgi:outer membrane protein OmpA-like peptidoglycan-associated protein
MRHLADRANMQPKECFMISFMRIAFLALLLMSTSGCAKKLMVALIPDPNGATGSVSVESSAGSVTIDTAYQATTVGDATARPATPEPVGKEKLETIFKEALSIQPKQPTHFLLYFRQDTDLTPVSQQLLPDIMAMIKERNSTSILVVGHTDTFGSKEYNVSLSRNRADAVKKLLIKQGVDPAAITTTSHGKENPLIPTGDNVIEPKNRRVEVVVR